MRNHYDMSNFSLPKSESLDPIDILIGKRIRFRRNLLGLTQDALAKSLGISFQQIQKYESGQNKIYASRLYHIASMLKVPMSFFFEDENLKKPGGMSDISQDAFLQDNPMDKSETTTLIRTYYNIEDKKKRKTAIEMMKGLKSR